MIDIQNQPDKRNIPLAKVGVKGLEYPIRVLDKVNKNQYTTAKVDLFANLPRHFKGTHMSRFIEIFHQYRQDLSMQRFLAMLENIRQTMEAESSFGSISFPYFIEKKAPVSGLPGMMSYQCCYQGERNATGKRFTVSIAVPITTVCPCSKAISERGAHNQRGIVTVMVESESFFWIEDLIDIVEKSASSPVYSLLKREDEKFITEQAYDNPKFVEDVVRDVLASVKALDKFLSFSVTAENFESIHNHSAFAYAEYPSGV
ncbi:MAG: GTP cyclohydrolase FolE2 [Treponema sp.]|jgi:GTP cyclohydrolase I|nr:GTP cyclohydrolase FolE2 [Treponema sp.]